MYIHTHTHIFIYMYIHTYIYIYICMQHAYVAVVNRSDFEQQFDGHYAVQKHTLFMFRVLGMPLMPC